MKLSVIATTWFVCAAQLTGPTSSTRIWVDDVNSDGKLDILVGDNVTLISLPEGIAKEEYEQKHAKNGRPTFKLRSLP